MDLYFVSLLYLAFALGILSVHNKIATGMDNDDVSRQSVLFGEIPLNGTDTRSYTMKIPSSNGSRSDVDIKNSINIKRTNSVDETSAVINIDMDGKSSTLLHFAFLNQRFVLCEQRGVQLWLDNGKPGTII